MNKENNLYEERRVIAPEEIRKKIWRFSSPLFVRLLRMFLLSGSVFLIGLGLTTIEIALWATLAALIGIWFGEKAGQSSLRIWVILAFGFLGISFLLWLSQLIVNSEFFVSPTHPTSAIALSETIRWVALAGLGLFSLRAASYRFSYVAIIELIIPLWTVISLLSSHRYGSIHRPQWLADWALGKGEDPIWYLMLFGLMGAIFLGIGLLKVRKVSQFFGGLIILLLLIWFFFWLSFHPSEVRHIKQLAGGTSSTQNSKQQHLPFRPPPPSKGQKKPIAVVIFETDYTTKRPLYYFRQRTLSRYNGIRMQGSLQNGIDQLNTTDFPPEGTTVRLDPVEGKRFTVITKISLLTSHTNPFGLVAPQSFQGILNPNPRVFVRSYRAVSKVWEKKLSLKDKVFSPNWTKSQRQLYLAAPKDKRYKALLAKILQPLQKSPYKDNLLARAFMIKMWLEYNGIYSISTKVPPDIRDHVAYFLFQTRIGYCVHFSHAAIYLMRLAGIPSRLAEGYAVPARFRGASSSLLIHESNAHAWPEIYVQGAGWVIFDIHPRRVLDHHSSSPDPKLRQMMSKLARQPPPQTKNTPSTPNKRNTKRTQQSQTSFGLNLLNLLLLFIFILYIMKFWRRWSYHLVPHSSRRAFLFYRSLEDRLAELNIRRELGMTLNAFASENQHLLPSFSLLTTHLNALSFQSQLSRPPFDRQMEKQLLSEFCTTVPWYFRYPTLFDPISWAFPILHRWHYFPPRALQIFMTIITFPSVMFERLLKTSDNQMEEL